MLNCQSCKIEFVIEPDDFVFYKKIDVPPPTFCPECRMQRRFALRNERQLFRSKCALTGKDVITCFNPEASMCVYDRDVWWSDGWDPLQYGMDYDFTKPFFTQFAELMHRAPMPAVFNGKTVNSPYCNHTGEYKDAYLVSASWGGENAAYASRCNFSKDCMDVFAITDCELCHELIASTKCYATFFSQNCESCNNSYFLYDCKGCSNCFGCTSLRNKQYYIFNESYTKETYLEKIKEFDFSSFAKRGEIIERVRKLKLKALHRFANLVMADRATGDNLSEVSNIKNCFDMFHGVRDCKFTMNGGVKMSDVYDAYGCGESSELMYEMIDSGLQASRLLFGGVVWGGHDVEYSFNCHNNENIFGCIGLRKKSYCILNKEYSESEFKIMRAKIIAQMNAMPYVDKRGRTYRYGEFFPIELSPFAYNETVANDYFPLSKSEAEAEGYSWRDAKVSAHTATMKAADLPDHVAEADDAVCDELIACVSCNKTYRIIKKELVFLKQFALALPRQCPECRHQARFHKTNFPRLYKRQCVCDYKIYENSIKHAHHPEGRCPNVFETSYAPDWPEIVYCESCYNAEII